MERKDRDHKRLSRTGLFRQQHDELAAHAEAFKCVQDGGEFEHMAQFTSKLQRHLTFEDHSLYPMLLVDLDERVRTLAIDCMMETGGLSEQVKGFRARWPDANAAKAAPEDFRKDSEALIKASMTRLERENADLFNLIDGIED